jgi:hypothetical protein
MGGEKRDEDKHSLIVESALQGSWPNKNEHIRQSHESYNTRDRKDILRQAEGSQKMDYKYK